MMRPRDPGGCEPSNALLTRNLEPEAKEGWGGGRGAEAAAWVPQAGGPQPVLPVGGRGARGGLWGLQGLFLGSLHRPPPARPSWPADPAHSSVCPGAQPQRRSGAEPMWGSLLTSSLLVLETLPFRTRGSSPEPWGWGWLPGEVLCVAPAGATPASPDASLLGAQAPGALLAASVPWGGLADKPAFQGQPVGSKPNPPGIPKGMVPLCWLGGFWGWGVGEVPAPCGLERPHPCPPGFSGFIPTHKPGVSTHLSGAYRRARPAWLSA